MCTLSYFIDTDMLSKSISLYKSLTTEIKNKKKTREHKKKDSKNKIENKLKGTNFQEYPKISYFKKTYYVYLQTWKGYQISYLAFFEHV